MNKNKVNEQFDVLSNSLRILPEEIMRLDYFLKEVNDPEEGISNIELACINVFNNIYGMMCALKDGGFIKSIYEHDSITTALCIRHILQHQSGRLKNNLRDSLNDDVKGVASLIKYNISNQKIPDQPLFININWFQAGIAESKNSNRLMKINDFLNLNYIKKRIDDSHHSYWESAYVCVISLITESVRTIVKEYGKAIKPIGYDSTVYLQHFKDLDPLDSKDFGILS